MRKLTSDLENPIDNIIYIFVELAAPYAHKMGLTPNMITTLSILCSIISIYYLYQYLFLISIAFYILSYFFDCLDGYVARKYNMVTKFGDIYDHVSDIVSFLAHISILYLINSQLFIMFLPIILFFIIGAQIHLAFQELYYNKPNESITLNLLTNVFVYDKNMSKPDIQNILKYTRYFGLGTLQFAIVCITLVYYNFYSQ